MPVNKCTCIRVQLACLATQPFSLLNCLHVLRHRSAVTGCGATCVDGVGILDMRLLNTSTLEFKDFFKPPPYAILSHRWGEDEVWFDDHERGSNRDGPGYQKIISCCAFAQSRGRDWVWIDTCCIDKRSSAELSEAINSMWEWYGKAEECYAHLADVSGSSRGGPFDTTLGTPSAWFNRGWTLQELLAPRIVIFCDTEWRTIGQKKDAAIMAEITKITSIPLRCLASHFSLNHAPVAQKLSWASRRVTTRT